MALLKVDDIHVYYGSIHAVKGVSFQVNEGEIVTLIGANGAGKSTVLNTVSGLLHPRGGSVSFMDQDLKGVAPHKVVERGLAQVPEGRRIFLQMTVEENLEMGAYTQPNSAVEPGIADVYQRFPRLQERRRQVAGTLSGGEQQMLAMGRALMSKPRLLMLDEPSMGLAPLLVEQIFDIIRELHAAGTTILLVEQNAQAALSVADRAYVLETGRISLSGTGAELMASDKVREALKHGTLSIGFIGLAEAMVALFDEHHGESDEVWDRAYETIKLMRDFCDEKTEEDHLNFSLLATPAEGLSGKFVRIDKERYGEIPGVTDREYYTNSFHIPVYYNIGIAEKIEKEGPFHELCNAGHITYVELDGDTSRNIKAFESVIRCMHDNGIGYGSINHPVDRCPICGFQGVIYDECPQCHRKEFEAVPEEYRDMVDEIRKSGMR